MLTDLTLERTCLGDEGVGPTTWSPFAEVAPNRLRRCTSLHQPRESVDATRALTRPYSQGRALPRHRLHEHPNQTLPPAHILEVWCERHRGRGPMCLELSITTL